MWLLYFSRLTVKFMSHNKLFIRASLANNFHLKIKQMVWHESNLILFFNCFWNFKSWKTDHPSKNCWYGNLLSLSINLNLVGGRCWIIFYNQNLHHPTLHLTVVNKDLGIIMCHINDCYITSQSWQYPWNKFFLDPIFQSNIFGVKNSFVYGIW